MRLPTHKGDWEAAVTISEASDQELLPHLAKVLEWLQDMNWPIAPGIADRLTKLDPKQLRDPVAVVLRTDDVMWIYWMLTVLAPPKSELARQLMPELRDLRERYSSLRADALAAGSQSRLEDADSILEELEEYESLLGPEA